MRESVEIEWTAHVPGTKRPRRRWPWELLPALIVVLLPLTSVNVIALASAHNDDPELGERHLLGIDVPLHATPVQAGWTADYGGLSREAEYRRAFALRLADGRADEGVD
jgi:hypothetical protein